MRINASRLGADPSRVRRVLQVSGLPARSTSRQKRSGNVAALLARKVTRAGNEAAILIAFTFHLRSGCGIGYRMNIPLLTTRSRISRISNNT